MGLVSRFRAAYRALTTENFPSELLGPPVAAGVSVTQDTARSVSAYWNGLNVISGDIGVLDRHLYRRTEDDDRERVAAHPVYKVVHDAPNEYTTPMVFWQTLMFHALSWGNGYAEIEWDNAMRPIALWLIPPDRLTPMIEVLVDARGRRISRLYYQYTGVNGPARLEPDEVIHVPGLGYDGIKGYSVVTVARQSLGLSMAAEGFGATFFGQGAFPGVVLEHPKELSTGAQTRLRDSFNAMHQGPDRAHRVFIAEEGMKLARQGLTIPPDDAQFLETRAFQIEEVARWLNLPTWKLKHKMGERPGGNAEANQIEYLQSTLLPWTTRIEQELNRKLISKPQRGSHYVEHLYEKLLQVDVATRVAAEKAWIDMKVITPVYVAKKENFPRPPKAEPAPAPPPVPPPAAAPAPTAEPPVDRNRRAKSLDAQRHVTKDRLAQYVRREVRRVRSAAGKDAGDFEAWLDDFYSRERGVLTDVLLPLVRLRLSVAPSEDDPLARAEALADQHVTRSREELLSLGAKNLAFEAERLVKTWESQRANDLTDAIMALGVEEEQSDAA